MKSYLSHQIIASLFIIAPVALANAVDQPKLTGCAAKEHDIQKQIDYANSYGNKYRVAGLENALREVRSNCSDESLLREHKNNIKEKQKKVYERTQELKEAQETGLKDKIAKRQKKLEEANKELSEAQSSLTK